MPKTNLVIVESPAKAKTIAGYLGKDFDVRSSLGHLRDLPSKGLGIDVKNNFKPSYEVNSEKLKTARELKKAAKGSTVWLATDEDREGEAIAWHLCEILGLDPATTKRIAFHEITKPAIFQAIENPRNLDMKLVDSQQARRILDRLVGYELSPVLWKKIRTGLSAGRVQSVAVRLLVEREKEIRDFNPAETYRVTGEFAASGDSFAAELDRRLTDWASAESFIEDCQLASFNVIGSLQKPGSRNPSPPFTTSTLQQEASRRLGYGVRQTMRLAQKLYETGHITYMRTDSTNLSPLAIAATERYITKVYGKNYVKTRLFKTKNSSAQEAHEAIRPTQTDKLVAGEDAQQQKLYKLIWQKMVASQMAAAIVELSEIRIGISNRQEVFVAKGQVVVFDGFMKVYKAGKEDRLLPKLEKGQALTAKQISAEQTFSRPPSRYSEALLVKKLEELGIGRPSTYAPTISTIQDRGYVDKKDLEGEGRKIRQLVLADGSIQDIAKDVVVGADRRKLVPTELAEIVTKFLVKYFDEIMDYGFTAKAETELDQIAEGKLVWQTMIERFYTKLHPLVASSIEAKREEASGSRQLGTDPKTGLIILARYGRYGPVLQLGHADEKAGTKPKFAPMPADVRLEDVTLEQALPMFSLPRAIGKTIDQKDIVADIGRFGPYLKVEKSYTSLKDHNPFKITEAEARQVLASKAKIMAEKVIADFGKLKVLNGPYGPYVTDGKLNVRVPKDDDPNKYTLADAQKLLDNPPAKRARRYRAKK